MSTTFESYRDAFPNARLTRDDAGVLEIALHTDGGKLIFNGHSHEQFVDLFRRVGEDRENRVVILTGSGEAFMDPIDGEGFDFFSPVGYDKIWREGNKILMNILDIEVPMIAALNGPVLLHSEYALLCDIVLARPQTVFQDKPHFDLGIVPGDGVNLLWPEVIGTEKNVPHSRATQLATHAWSSVEGALILSRVLRSPEPFDLAIAQLAATAEAEADASIQDTRQDTVS